MIEVESLQFTYPGAAERTLDGLSFSIESQEIFGFLGPSGSGKSTTQKILIGLLRGYEGQVSVMGRGLEGWGRELYEHVGVCFELPNHYRRLSARENLQHFGGLYARGAERVQEVLQWVGLEADADKRVSDFSKGMKIRLNLARSLLHAPKLLFLDEPTGGLDPVNARRIKDLVLRLRDEGTTVFVTTHDMSVADQLCDRVGLLASGQLRVVDSPAALKKRHGQRRVRIEYVDADEVKVEERPLDGLGEDEAFLRILREHRVETMHTQETSLENVFIEVTGEALVP